MIIGTKLEDRNPDLKWKLDSVGWMTSVFDDLDERRLYATNSLEFFIGVLLIPACLFFFQNT